MWAFQAIWSPWQPLNFVTKSAKDNTQMTRHGCVLNIFIYKTLWARCGPRTTDHQSWSRVQGTPSNRIHSLICSKTTEHILVPGGVASTQPDLSPHGGGSSTVAVNTTNNSPDAPFFLRSDGSVPIGKFPQCFFLLVQRNQIKSV